MDGVILTPLKQIPHPKGDIFHVMKKSDAGFAGFGEAYFSFIKYREIKGWKKHTKMTLNLVVPVGSIKFRLLDGRVNSPTNGKQQEFILSADEHYSRLTIPIGIWVCFEGLSEQNMLLNIANIEHIPDESENANLASIGIF